MPDSVTRDGTTTYGDDHPDLTALLTDIFRKWPEFTARQRADVLASCMGATDPELRAVVSAWLELPEPIRAGIVAMVKAATAGSGTVIRTDEKPNGENQRTK